MDSSISPKDEIWFLRVCHHISTCLYLTLPKVLQSCKQGRKQSCCRRLYQRHSERLWAFRIPRCKECLCKLYVLRTDGTLHEVLPGLLKGLLTRNACNAKYRMPHKIVHLLGTWMCIILFFYFNTYTVHLILLFIITNKCTINVMKVYITAVYN